MKFTDRGNWHTISIMKHPDYDNWTFRRCAGQNLVWMIFGNDNDGVTPYFRDKHWSFWRWWLRNRFSNFKWYVIGYAWWEESKIPYSSWYTGHLEVKYWINKIHLIIYWIKPIRRTWLAWRPNIKVKIGDFEAKWGWGERGNFRSSIKVRE